MFPTMNPILTQWPSQPKNFGGEFVGGQMVWL